MVPFAAHRQLDQIGHIQHQRDLPVAQHRRSGDTTHARQLLAQGPAIPVMWLFALT
ncbi:MAG: hypothetical protein GY767_09400 [Shimia sp.]|nr:hypothetical protein [Shimia sp.]